MRWKSLFEPRIAIGGLSIGSSAVCFIKIVDGKLRKEMVKLGPGIFQDGKLKNWKPLLRALAVLREKLGKSVEKIPVVFSLPECGIQLKRFNLPSGTLSKDIDSAAALNLQMISPMDIRDAFYDWQNLDGEYLGAFVHRGIVEQYLRLLNEAGFSAVAVEFSALSVARLIKEQASVIDFSKPHAVLLVSENGLEIFIIKNSSLFSNYFAGLDSGKKIEEAVVSGLENAIGQEAVNNLILVAPGLNQAIEPIIRERLPFLRIKPLALSSFFDLQPVWYAGLGGALRLSSLAGQADQNSRNEKWIDLSPSGTRDEFARLEKLAFISAWQKLILKISLALAILFIGGSVLVNVSLNRLEAKVASLDQSAEFQEAQFLNKVRLAKEQSNDFSGILEKLRGLAAPEKIDFIQLDIKSGEGKIILKGSAAKEADVIKFKDKLTAAELFKEIILPLAEIVTHKDGVSFSLTLNF